MLVEAPILGLRALFFDVFGTLVDWRSSVAREAERILGALGYQLDWLAFSDAWRGEYQPGMEDVRSGRLPFAKLDASRWPRVRAPSRPPIFPARRTFLRFRPQRAGAFPGPPKAAEN